MNPSGKITVTPQPTRRSKHPSFLFATLALLGVLTGWTQAELTMNGFDLNNAIIPVRDILSGGPPRDGIPSIDAPQFIQPSQADFMKDEDLVVSVTFDGQTRAYPLRILVWHEIVNDVVGGHPIAVTYCPLCGTAMVFDRRVGERTLTFGVSGLLYQSDVLMYDRETESLWSQLKMQSVSGPQATTHLNWLSSEHLTWAAWESAYPEGMVLSTDTGFPRNYKQMPYAGYETEEATMYPAPYTRTELKTKDWVIGIIVGSEARAYPVDGLPANQRIEDLVGGSNIAISYDPVSHRPSVVNANRQEAVPYVMAYWFAWQAFHPETSLWSQ